VALVAACAAVQGAGGAGDGGAGQHGRPPEPEQLAAADAAVVVGLGVVAGDGHGGRLL
jgi:hypothetical protein